MQLDLMAAGEAAAGRRVDVHVTDWPEWRRRSERVAASFEARVAGSAVVLFDREPVVLDGAPDAGAACFGRGHRLASARSDQPAFVLRDCGQHRGGHLPAVGGEVEALSDRHNGPAP